MKQNKPAIWPDSDLGPTVKLPAAHLGLMGLSKSSNEWVIDHRNS